MTNPISTSSPLNAVSVFAGAQAPQRGGAGRDGAVLRHLCETYRDGDAASVASVEDAALLGVKRLQAGNMTPASFSEFMSGMYTIAKQMREAIHERTAWLVEIRKSVV